MNWKEVLTTIGALAAIFIAIGYAFFQIVEIRLDKHDEVSNVKFEKIEQGQTHIKELFTNHVTDTDKKVDKIDNKLEKLDSKVVVREKSFYIKQ